MRPALKIVFRWELDFWKFGGYLCFFSHVQLLKLHRFIVIFYAKTRLFYRCCRLSFRVHFPFSPKSIHRIIFSPPWWWMPFVRSWCWDFSLGLSKAGRLEKWGTLEIKSLCCTCFFFVIKNEQSILMTFSDWFWFYEHNFTPSHAAHSSFPVFEFPQF